MSSCVVALLTANAFAIALIETDNPLSSADAPHELTLITTSDGHRYLVDPNTDAGKQAIAEAKKNGSTLQNVPVPTTSSTNLASQNPGNPLPTLPPINGILPIDPGSTLDHTVDSILSTVTTVSSVVGSVVTTVSTLLDDTQSTVSSILNDTQSTLDQVSTTLAGVVTTVSTTVGGVVTTVSTTVDSIVSTTVGNVVTTLTTLLGQLNQTATTLTNPTTPTTVSSGNPICGLLSC